MILNEPLKAALEAGYQVDEESARRVPICLKSPPRSLSQEGKPMNEHAKEKDLESFGWMAMSHWERLLPKSRSKFRAFPMPEYRAFATRGEGNSPLQPPWNQFNGESKLPDDDSMPEALRDCVFLLFDAGRDQIVPQRVAFQTDARKTGLLPDRDRETALGIIYGGSKIPDDDRMQHLPPSRRTILRDRMMGRRPPGPRTRGETAHPPSRIRSGS